VSEGHGSTEDPAVDRDRNLVFVDARQSTIHKVESSGRASTFAGHGGASGLMLGPDGRLYGSGRRGIHAYDATGKGSTIATGTPGNDLAEEGLSS
jgi:sugar lactone lactonase YvrE